MPDPNFELLRFAYAVIDGIPAERINLQVIADNDDPKKQNDPNHCGTIGCALGWLGMHPHFRELGLKTSEHGYIEGALSCFIIAAKVFGISHADAINLFARRNGSLLDDRVHPDQSDKAIFQRRVKQFIRNREWRQSVSHELFGQ